jgi:nucleoside-diphosphate-sugar epimerase
MTVLVTGGGGFLGGAIVRRLHARGVAVRSLTRSAYPWLAELNVPQFHGDLNNAAVLTQAAKGCDAVIHTAAKAGVWGRWNDYYSTNVAGTEAVINACKAARVPALIYTSTPSVVHTGHDIENGDESLPYAEHYLAPYPASKARAEQKVLAANGPDLATVALRPHLIWGPGDPHLVPRILARARAGKLRRVGTRDVTVDATYIDNAADAHVNALDRLGVGAPCAGKAYFISNGEPVKLWDFLNRILALASLPPVVKSIPVWLARTFGRAAELGFKIFRFAGEPAMTRFIATQLSTSHWYNLSAARRDLGYEPKVTIEQGLVELGKSIQRTSAGS